MDEENKEVEQQEKPLNPDLAGYPDVESLVQGYRASGSEAKKWRETAEQRERELASVRAVEANPRQTVKDRSRPQDRLAEFGIPVDALQDLLREQIQETFAPIAAGLNARQSLQARYPDYNKFESDVAQFIESEPDTKETYNRMFNADPAGAFEYAFLKFGESRRRGTKERGETSREDAVHSSIPMGRNGEARRQPEGQAVDVQSAWRKFQETGSPSDARAYAKARLRTVIKDDFLNA